MEENRMQGTYPEVFEEFSWLVGPPADSFTIMDLHLSGPRHRARQRLSRLDRCQKHCQQDVTSSLQDAGTLQVVSGIDLG